MSFIKQDTEDTNRYSHDFQNYIDNETKTEMFDVGSAMAFRLRNETRGGRFKNVFVGDEVLRIIKPVLQTINETKSKEVVNEAKDLISTIVDLTIDFQRLNIDIGKIPALNATNLEDDSLLIEWTFPTFRIGFVIETNKEDSIWYLVSTIEKTDFNKSGSLIDIDKKIIYFREPYDQIRVW